MELYKPFVFYPTSILTKGVCRSLICDTERQKYYLIPNLLYDILSDPSVKCLAEVLEKYANDDNEKRLIVSDYFEFLLKNDLLFYSGNGKYYMQPALEYFYPGHISNCIIDIDKLSMKNLEIAIRQLDELYCRCLQIRVYSFIGIKQLDEISRLTEGSVLEWIEYIIPFNQLIVLDDLKDLCLKNKRLRLVVLYGYDVDEIIWQSSGSCRITGIKQLIDSEKHCGVISPAYFTSNLISISEGMNMNSCLNKKIGIDKDGYIKNCPSLKRSFGHIKSTKLIDACRSDGFTDLWGITKDKVLVCKNCEFRNICTDCRAYIEDPENNYSKPLKCGYDPITGVWEKWSDNPLKQIGMNHYKIGYVTN